MDHNDIRHSLSEYLDGSISEQQKAGIEAHLKTCAECSKALEDLRKTIEQIRSIEQVDPPTWMTQKIMANVREEAAKKKSLFEKIFYPLTVKLPIQAVAMAFLAVTAFYMYQETDPTKKYAEAPVPTTQEIAGKKEAPQRTRTDEDAFLSDARRFESSRQKSSRIKSEHKKPAAPLSRNEMPASAPAPKTAPEKKEMMLERRVTDEFVASSEAPVTEKRIASDAVKAKSRSTQATFQQEILERHPNGNPRLVITYEIEPGRKFKRAEERFNAAGERDGIQKEFYSSGQLKAEATYEAGTLGRYAEFENDGREKTGESDRNWFWLKK